LRHGTHQVAHRFNRTVRPFQSDSFFGCPSLSTKASRKRRAISVDLGSDVERGLERLAQTIKSASVAKV